MKIHLDQMQAAASKAEELLKAVGNRHRLMLLCQMAGGERSVGELAESLKLRDSTVSQHLALLRKDGLVSTRRDGQTIWYALSSEPAQKLIEALQDIYCKPLPAKGKVAKRNGKVRS